MIPRGLARLAWIALGLTVGVIVWGAYVRASGSGAGCGSHWPDCNGEVIPRPKSLATLIEVTHRGTSGLALIVVVLELWWASRALAAGHRVRSAAAAATLLMLGEAGIGAGLVRLELVGHDASMLRAVVMSVHLANTFLLLASLTLAAWWSTEAGGKPRPSQPTVSWKGLGIGAIGMLFVGASGAVAALGDTLFPASSLAEGMAADTSSAAHWLVHLRVWHPVLASCVGLWTLWAAASLAARGADGIERRLGATLAVAIFVQLGAGVLNLVLLAPVATQLLHLFLADAVWIALVLAMASTRREEVGRAPRGVIDGARPDDARGGAR